MKKIIGILLALIMLTALLAACGTTDSPAPQETDAASPSPSPSPSPDQTPDPATNEVEWISPMLAIDVSSNEASEFTGGPLIEISTNDFGRENRGKIAAEEPVEGQEGVVPAQFTEADLLAGGALKMTAGFAYEGDGTYPVRFRVRVDRFQGHSITAYGLSASEGVLVLWQDADGVWWNIRRTGWGGEFTGGKDLGLFDDYAAFTFEINKDTAKDYATQDFYLVFIEDVPFRVNDAGVVTDEMAGYVITYQAELPDEDGHFHNFDILASTSTYIHVPCDDDTHDHGHDGGGHDGHDHAH